MNIESVQAANPPQRAVAAEAPPQLNRQDRTASTAPTQYPPLRAQTAPDANTEQNRLSVQDAVNHLADFASIARADISFAIEETSGVQVVKIIDSESKEVIRQFPSEEAIRIAQALDKLQGVFVKDKA